MCIRKVWVVLFFFFLDSMWISNMYSEDQNLTLLAPEGCASFLQRLNKKTKMHMQPSEKRKWQFKEWVSLCVCVWRGIGLDRKWHQFNVHCSCNQKCTICEKPRSCKKLAVKGLGFLSLCLSVWAFLHLKNWDHLHPHNIAHQWRHRVFVLMKSFVKKQS